MIILLITRDIMHYYSFQNIFKVFSHSKALINIFQIIFKKLKNSENRKNQRKKIGYSEK